MDNVSIASSNSTYFPNENVVFQKNTNSTGNNPVKEGGGGKYAKKMQ